MSSSVSPARVTIGVPAYNAERYLALTLDSLLAQTYTAIEIVICDNASTDGTAEIVRQYAARDTRIRYVRNPRNIGAARNFIRCVEETRTELFRWQSADDLSAPTFIERCVAVLDARPDVVQAYPRCVLIDENGCELEKYVEKIEALSDSPRVRYLHVMHNIGLVNAFYGVIRTNALRRTAIHGAYLGADLIVQAEIALYGKIFEVPEYLFFRRMHRHAHSAMSMDEKLAFYNPTSPPIATFTRWRQFRERLRSVARSPLGVAEKCRLAGAITRDATSSRDQLMVELQAGIKTRLLRHGRPSR
jgi:glycosyltransferase involved in cell wall biosynthesis